MAAAMLGAGCRTAPPERARLTVTPATRPAAAPAGGGIAQRVRPVPDAVMSDSIEIDGEMVRVVCPADTADRARAIASGPAPRFPSQVDRPAVELPAPPGRAASTGGGTATLRFVVDPSGVPEPATITLIRSTGPQDAARACGAALRARYEPGRVAGRAVRQWVERTF